MFKIFHVALLLLMGICCCYHCNFLVVNVAVAAPNNHNMRHDYNGQAGNTRASINQHQKAVEMEFLAPTTAPMATVATAAMVAAAAIVTEAAAATAVMAAVAMAVMAAAAAAAAAVTMALTGVEVAADVARQGGGTGEQKVAGAMAAMATAAAAMMAVLTGAKVVANNDVRQGGAGGVIICFFCY